MSLSQLIAVYPTMPPDRQHRWKELFDPKDGGKDWRADLREDGQKAYGDSADVRLSGTISFRDTRNRLVAARGHSAGHVILKRDAGSGELYFVRMFDERWKQ